MPSSIIPPDGSVLPSKLLYDVLFTFAPGIPPPGGTGGINVHWAATSGGGASKVKFAKTPTVTNPDGTSSNKVSLPTGSETTDFELTDDAGNTLLNFTFDFKTVIFKGYDGAGGGISYPNGLQNVYPFGSPADAIQNGVQVSVQVLEDVAGQPPVQNLPVIFTSDNNAVDFYKVDGTPIPSLGVNAGQTATALYLYPTDGTGTATVIGMPKGKGIYNVKAGGVSDAKTAHGRIVLLDEIASSEEDSIDSLEFPTLDSGDNKIDLDESVGPFFPVDAPTSILGADGGPIEKDDPVVVVSYPDGADFSDGQVLIGPITAGALTTEVLIAKSSASTTGETSYYYMASNNVGTWVSSVMTVGAKGKTVSGPDPKVPRLKSKPNLPDANLVNRDAIIGGLRIQANTFLVNDMAAAGLQDGDAYLFNAYLDGWDGNSANPKGNVAYVKGQVPTGAISGGNAFYASFTQDWFVGYGHNGTQPGKVQFEMMGYKANGEIIYSALLPMALDTTG